jgi:pyruvate/2-oxoglutarate dehydrogenase complex dihydrolipoamide acyltransferase (E2) component
LIQEEEEMAELFEVKVPHSGSVENVEITEWTVSLGDVVAEGDVLAEVSTDKVDTELEAPQGGKIVRLLVEDGDEVAVGSVVALLAPADASDEDIHAAVSAYTPDAS